MKKAIGVILLLLVLACLIGVTCATYGLKAGLAAWATGFVIALIVVIAMALITGD